MLFWLQTSLEIRSKIRKMCIEISEESGKALLEIASSTKKMTQAKSANPHTAKAKDAMEKLNSHLKTNLWKEAFLLEIILVAKLLIEVVECTEKIAQAVHELALAGSFRDRGWFGVARKATMALHSKNSLCFHHGCTELRNYCRGIIRTIRMI